jgi:hypothetical protein
VYDAPISLLRKPEQFNITNAENYCRWEDVHGEALPEKSVSVWELCNFPSVS